MERTPAQTCLLTIGYKTFQNTTNDFTLAIEQKSSFEIDNLFYLQLVPEQNIIYVFTKLAQIETYDKPEMSFTIRFVSSTASNNKLNGPTPSSYVNVFVRVLSNRRNSNLVILNPAVPNTVLFIMPNNIVNYNLFTLKANQPNNNSIIKFRIVNSDLNMFYISPNNSLIVFPFYDFNYFVRPNFLVSEFFLQKKFN
jgi:hypothetical protein